jgi:hypothetical protein
MHKVIDVRGKGVYLKAFLASAVSVLHLEQSPPLGSVQRISLQTIEQIKLSDFLHKTRNPAHPFSHILIPKFNDH